MSSSTSKLRLSAISFQKALRMPILWLLSSSVLLLNPARTVDSEWPLQMGFDATGSIINTQFDLVGITTNSLRSRAIEEQIKQPLLRAELEPPKKKKGQPDPEMMKKFPPSLWQPHEIFEVHTQEKSSTWRAR
jgi:hypothetical protein